MTGSRAVVLACLALAAGILGACGDGGSAAPQTAAAIRVEGPHGYLDRAALQRRLSNAFRAGLYRLAVMTQAGDAAADSGQVLPTGTVRAVRCGAAADRPAPPAAWRWGCDVRWRGVTGPAHRTAYQVELSSRSCFDAVATPAFAAIADATINAPAEHPLNAFGRALGSC
jgi:hypothetical protein